jgi:hypothetical protein
MFPTDHGHGGPSLIIETNIVMVNHCFSSQPATKDGSTMKTVYIDTGGRDCG